MDEDDYLLLRPGEHGHPGSIRLLTIPTYGELPLFAEWPSASAAAAQVAPSWRGPGVRLLCWVLMPAYWQGLAQVCPGGNLAQAMRQAKGAMASAAGLASGRSGVFWTPGYLERTLRPEEDPLMAARYVVNAPVRGGLVGNARYYPYWDAIWL